MLDAENKIKSYIRKIYKNNRDASRLLNSIVSLIDEDNLASKKKLTSKNWSQKSSFLITYSDSIKSENDSPLLVLNQFLQKYIDSIDSIHILPFMPSSSDSGFSVIDYYQIDEKFGDWKDLNLISKNKNIMIDIVLNHASRNSKWFANFLKGSGQGHDFFKVVKDWNGIAQIERPRSSELFQKIQTVDGEKNVWCTFSHDQIDLDFSNPAVLLEFLKIIKFYIKKNIKIFRLDAVAFLWKKQNTSCINLQETHYIIKLIRFVSTLIDKNAILITETNIPSKENLSYFGNNDEAHWIYNFTLSPLILFTLLSGNCSQLRKWSMTMPPAQEGNAYFNFLASHDGIGLRPVEGKLDSTELYRLINKMRDLGGKISYKTSQWGEEIPYEINITYLDSLKSTFNGEEKFQIKRFICAHTIMFAMEGIPAIYIHSFLGTKNDHKAIAAGEGNRSINRFKWDKKDIYKILEDKNSNNFYIMSKLNSLLNIRSKQPAFHPNATQFTLNLGDEVFGLWRQDKKRKQSIFSIYNVTSKSVKLSLQKINLIETEKWIDLISGEALKDIDDDILLKPYQSLWISNYNSEK
ncbi:alpha-amylase family glycosyl hydrolase [bacterium]|nr:alpha-amylase family glycosyl hydrolase [bacterium]